MAGTRAELVARTNGISYCWTANAQESVSNSELEAILNDVTANSDWPDIDLFGTYHPAYNAWLAEHFTGVERNEGLDSILLSPDADPDGDRLPNAAEYYLGLDPRQANRSPFSVVIVGDKMRIRWQRKSGIEGASIAIRSSVNLSTWSSVSQPTIVNRPDLISLVGYQYQEVLVPMTQAKRFARFDFNVH